MIIHPSSPPLVMAALDAHLLHSQHLTLAFLTLTVSIATLLNGLFKGAEGGGGAEQGRKLSKSFQYVKTQLIRHWEGLL